MSKGIPTRSQINDYAIVHGLKVEIKPEKDLYERDRITVIFDHPTSTDDRLVNFRIRQDMAHALAINNGVVYGGGYNSNQFYEKRKGT